MSDFPSARYELPIISSYGACGAAFSVAIFNSVITAGGGAALWPSANLALYFPFRLSAPYVMRTMWWANGTAVAGSVDAGIYGRDGTKLYSTGLTAQAGTSTVQSVSLATPLCLQPDMYYMAMNSSAGSATFNRTAYGVEQSKSGGFAQQAVGAVTLPATASMAAIATAYQPLFGIASATVI